MNMLANTEKSKTTTAKTSTTTKTTPQLDKFILGDSECNFEVAKYLDGKLDPAAVKRLFANPRMSILASRGKSLKVHFEVENENPDVKNEVKFVGFITAADASLELDETDIERIAEHIGSGDIIRAVKIDNMIAMF